MAGRHRRGSRIFRVLGVLCWRSSLAFDFRSFYRSSFALYTRHDGLLSVIIYQHRMEWPMISRTTSSISLLFTAADSGADISVGTTPYRPLASINEMSAASIRFGLEHTYASRKNVIAEE